MSLCRGADQQDLLSMPAVECKTVSRCWRSVSCPLNPSLGYYSEYLDCPGAQKLMGNNAVLIPGLVAACAQDRNRFTTFNLNASLGSVPS